MASMTRASQVSPPPQSSVAGLGFASSSITKGNNGNSTQLSGSRRILRRRLRGACEVCRRRRIRCDAMTLGAPCTNCTAFAIECIVLQGKAANKSLKDEEGPKMPDNNSKKEKESSVHPMQLLGRQLMDGEADLNLFVKLLDPKYRRTPIEPGKVGYLAENADLALLAGEEAVHYPKPGNIGDSRTKLAKLGKDEISLLRQRGVLFLPHWSQCDVLIEAYFQYVAPAVPIINRSRFMRQYRDPNNSPSLLLLQCIFLAGSKAISLKYSKGSKEATIPSPRTFYKRAKALYDSEYEDDRIIVLQALILLGWYGEENGDTTKNGFYWTGLATTVAQCSGVHRSTERSRLPKADKRLWKRIWWTLFIRDQLDAIAYGRPAQTNTDDSDVEMICAEDFLDDEEGRVADYHPDPIQVHFFIQYTYLCKITRLLQSSKNLTPLQDERQNSECLKQCDLALGDWLQNRPEEVRWEQSKHSFWSAILHCAYHVTMGLRHRVLLPIIPFEEDLYGEIHPKSHIYSLPPVICQTAYEITIAAESMIRAGQIQFSPAIMIYALVSALKIHIYQMDVENPSLTITAHQQILTCMSGLEKLSTAWIAAIAIYGRFKTILNNRGYYRNPLGENKLAKDGESTVNPVNGSHLNLTYRIAERPSGAEPFTSQYRDKLKAGNVDSMEAAMFPQNYPAAPTLQSLPFPSMNLVEPAERVGYDVVDSAPNMSYPASQPAHMSHYPSQNLKMSLPESHEESSSYKVNNLFHKT